METDVFLRALLLDLPLPLSFKPSFFPLPLLLRLRDEIAVTAMSSSIQSAAQRFGLQEDLVMETIHDFVSEVERAGKCRPGKTQSSSLRATLRLRPLPPCPQSPGLLNCQFAGNSNVSGPSAKVRIRASTQPR